VSDFGRSGGDGPTPGDWWRYGWLFVLGSLVLLLLLSQLEGTFLILLAIYLVAVTAAGTVVLVRRSRS